jgi:acyl-CoA thioester hydrolase
MNPTITPSKIDLPLDRLYELPSIMEVSRKVRFQDCDPFGHLNNSAYLDYFVNAREDQVAEHYNLDFYQWSQVMGTGWVFGKHEILYRRPAMFNETVILRSRLIHFGEKFVKIEATMLDAQAKILKSVMWSDIVHVDLKTQRPAAHAPELMTLFSAVNSPIAETDLNRRVKELEEELKISVAI